MKKKHFFEYVFIILFGLIILLLLGITTYQSIVNSEWYKKNERKKEFQEDISKINDDRIKYIEYYDAETKTEEYFSDIDVSVFSKIACDDYSKTLDELECHKVFSSDRISVFFEDGSLIDFYITDNFDVFWGTMKIKADNLIAWYLTIRD